MKMTLKNLLYDIKTSYDRILKLFLILQIVKFFFFSRNNKTAVLIEWNLNHNVPIIILFMQNSSADNL